MFAIIVLGTRTPLVALARGGSILAMFAMIDIEPRAPFNFAL